MINDPNHSKLYLRLEYVDGGQCMPSENGTAPLPVEKAQVVFSKITSQSFPPPSLLQAPPCIFVTLVSECVFLLSQAYWGDLICGLEYLHFNRVLHRCA